MFLLFRQDREQRARRADYRGLSLLHVEELGQDVAESGIEAYPIT